MNLEIKPSETGEFDKAILEISDWHFAKLDKLYLVINNPSSEKQYLAAEGWTSSIQKNLVFATYVENICRISIGSQLTKSLIYATNYLFIISDLDNNELGKFGKAWRGLPFDQVEEEKNINLSTILSEESNKAKEVTLETQNIFSYTGEIGTPAELDKIFDTTGSFDLTENPSQLIVQDTPKQLLICKNPNCGAEFFASLNYTSKLVCKWCGKPY